MNKLTIEDLDVKGKKVLLRVDLNVPLNENLVVTDNTRIQAAIPTIQYLLAKGAKLILISHLGRPKGKRSENLSLRPVAEVLGKILNQHIVFCPDILGPVVQSAISCLKFGECALLENIRFYPEEEKNDLRFSRELASIADLYVNDAFGTAHRAHASTEGIAKYFDQAACGYLMNKELTYLGNLIKSPASPFCAIIGGAKVPDKIGVVMRLLDLVDDILIGGGMSYTFLKEKGHDIGDSIYNAENAHLVHQAFEKAEKLGKTIHLPIDHLVAEKFSNDVPVKTVGVNIPNGHMGLDIGPKTIEQYLSVIQKAKTTFWNGPMGVFEMKNFQNGTFAIAQGMAENQGVTVVGGGDSVAAMNQTGLGDKVSHISTGGGASLEFLEGNSLPGVEVLTDK